MTKKTNHHYQIRINLSKNNLKYSVLFNQPKKECLINIRTQFQDHANIHNNTTLLTMNYNTNSHEHLTKINSNYHDQKQIYKKFKTNNKIYKKQFSFTRIKIQVLKSNTN